MGWLRVAASASLFQCRLRPAADEGFVATHSPGFLCSLSPTPPLPITFFSPPSPTMGFRSSFCFSLVGAAAAAPLFITPTSAQNPACTVEAGGISTIYYHCTPLGGNPDAPVKHYWTINPTVLAAAFTSPSTGWAAFGLRGEQGDPVRAVVGYSTASTLGEAQAAVYELPGGEWAGAKKLSPAAAKAAGYINLRVSRSDAGLSVAFDRVRIAPPIVDDHTANILWAVGKTVAAPPELGEPTASIASGMQYVIAPDEKLDPSATPPATPPSRSTPAATPAPAQTTAAPATAAPTPMPVVATPYATAAPVVSTATPLPRTDVPLAPSMPGATPACIPPPRQPACIPITTASPARPMPQGGGNGAGTCASSGKRCAAPAHNVAEVPCCDGGDYCKEVNKYWHYCASKQYDQ